MARRRDRRGNAGGAAGGRIVSPDYLLDTCVLVHAIRRTAVGQQIVTERKLDTEAILSAISIVTVGELYAIARLRGWQTDRMDRLDQLLATLDVVDISHLEVIDLYAELDVISQSPGRPAMG